MLSRFFERAQRAVGMPKPTEKSVMSLLDSKELASPAKKRLLIIGSNAGDHSAEVRSRIEQLLQSTHLDGEWTVEAVSDIDAALKRIATEKNHSMNPAKIILLGQEVRFFDELDHGSTVPSEAYREAIIREAELHGARFIDYSVDMMNLGQFLLTSGDE